MIAGLHRQDGSERQPEDFYASDPVNIIPLFKVLGA